VTTHPTAAWVWRQMIEATPWGQHPSYLVHDRDRVFGADMATRCVRGIHAGDPATETCELLCKEATTTPDIKQGLAAVIDGQIREARPKYSIRPGLSAVRIADSGPSSLHRGSPGPS
jgi:hypothetical protein